jgi:hypothetical protein
MRRDMEDDLVPLTTSSGPYLKGLIGGILQAGGIPHVIRDEFGPSPILGQDLPVVVQRFYVPPGRLSESKDLLCANGVVCELSERLLTRGLDEIVKPLLQAGEGRDLSRLSHFIEVNNKETTKALLAKAILLEGGWELLADTFFDSPSWENLPALRILARLLALHDWPRFHSRLFQAMTVGLPGRQIDVVEILGELPDTPERDRLLRLGLESADPEVRAAAEESPYSLGLDRKSPNRWALEADEDPSPREE